MTGPQPQDPGRRLDARALFDEIRSLSRPQLTPAARYRGLYALLDRLCAELSAGFATEYSGLFSRLYAVCRATHTDHRAADRFRRRARRVLRGEDTPDENGFRADLGLLLRFVADLTATEPPADLRARAGNAPHADRPAPHAAADGREEALRVLLTEIHPDRLVCLPADGSDTPLHVSTAAQPELAEEAEAGMQACLIGLRPGTPPQEAWLVILEPDFLIDVSALTACVKPYGSSPLHYFLQKLAPRALTAPILLGNAANQFMDDCLHERPAPACVSGNGGADGGTAAADEEERLFLHSIRKHFRTNPLDYVCCPDAVDAAFFDKARMHFRHIRRTVARDFARPEVDIRAEEVLLEPAFISPTLGLRGRLDVMTADHLRLIELKSGKAADFGRSPRTEHVLQMALYKEILHFHFRLPRTAVRSFLLYSAHPALFDERPAAEAVRDVLRLRNGIVRTEALLRRGRWSDLLPALTAEALNGRGMRGRLFEGFLRPALERLVRPLHGMTARERAYFTAATAFLAREQFLAKTHDARPGSQRGFARAWTADTADKRAAGDILTGLRIRETETEEGAVAGLVLDLPDYGEDFIPNFGIGEMVQLYQRNDEGTDMAHSQLIRATLLGLTEREARLRLTYPQRNARLFPAKSLYAIEKDATDAAFTQGYRGLYGLLTTLPERRALWLAEREPRRDTARRRRGDYGGMNGVVEAALQARDYYLLVGPPGTGKTNVALRAMVAEFMRQREAEKRRGEADEGADGLLLTAYTHRAVDEICGMLEELAADGGAATGADFDYVRLGHEQACAPRFRHRLLERRAGELKSRGAVAALLRGIPVYVGTLMTLSGRPELFRLKRFRAAIVDEASQVLEPQMLPLFCATAEGADGTAVAAIGKFIFIGDHRQLPAVVMQPPGKAQTDAELLAEMGVADLRQSLFERLYRLWLRERKPGIAGLLDRQGRMHPDICGFVSRYFYAGGLHSLTLPHQRGPLPVSRAPRDEWERRVAERRMVFVDVKKGKPGGNGGAPGADNPKCNAEEAEAVARLAEAIVRLHGGEEGGFDTGRRIGIIVPFRSQIGLVRTRLRQSGLAGAEEITIDTVECYQGSQRDFILFSATVSRPAQLRLLSEEHEAEGQLIDRKLNVAITRARMQFVLVGDGDLLSRSRIYRHLIDYCKKEEK